MGCAFQTLKWKLIVSAVALSEDNIAEPHLNGADTFLYLCWHAEHTVSTKCSQKGCKSWCVRTKNTHKKKNKSMSSITQVKLTFLLSLLFILLFMSRRRKKKIFNTFFCFYKIFSFKIYWSCSLHFIIFCLDHKQALKIKLNKIIPVKHLICFSFLSSWISCWLFSHWCCRPNMFGFPPMLSCQGYFTVLGNCTSLDMFVNLPLLALASVWRWASSVLQIWTVTRLTHFNSDPDSSEFNRLALPIMAGA